MVDVFRDVARAAGLGQFTNVCRRGTDAEIEEQSLARMERQVLPASAGYAQRIEFFTDGLPDLVESHGRGAETECIDNNGIRFV
ncbi:hypothetical protein Y024_5818 [Burkholderia pseudomallei TSV44]|nr:hypothetical protein Y024_5818 [Burkholderia pseudomallei TSV44]